MKILEYRILMPFTVEENEIGQLWTFAEISRLNTSGGEGVQILYNTEFDVPFDTDGKIINKNLPEYETTENKASKKASKKSKKEKKKGKRSKELHDDSICDKNIEEDELDESDIEDIEIGNTKEYVKNSKGQYTKKLYYMASKFPWYIQKVLPKNLGVIEERSWNMYPTVKTIFTNDYFKNSFKIELDTITKEVKNGQCDENVHNLTPEQLEKREVIVCDITDPVPQNEYKINEDPLVVQTTKTNRGPLKKDWISNTKPLICIYKLACVEFKVFGLQSRVETYLKGMYRQLFTNFNRQVFCWSDKWYDFSIKDVRQIEVDLAKILLKKIEEGEISKSALMESE